MAPSYTARGAGGSYQDASESTGFPRRFYELMFALRSELATPLNMLNGMPTSDQMSATIA
jgi:hypothetical protein